MSVLNLFTKKTADFPSFHELKRWGEEAKETCYKNKAKQTIKFGGNVIKLNKHDDFNFSDFN